MELTQSIVLALVQGLTEFLPVSSSAHLILVPFFAHWPDQGLVFDILLHLGSLMAVILYFRRDLHQMISQNTPLLWQLGVATIPICVVGLFLGTIAEYLRSPWVIAIASIFFGLLLWRSDKSAHNRHTLTHITYKQALMIGIWQALAVIPGTSRSGITMTGARWLGFDRVSATRFSFLLSIPTISLAVLSILKDGFPQQEGLDWPVMGVGLLVSFTTAYACIHGLMRFVARIGFLPFMIYRVLLGGAILCSLVL
jgi:undecaprenyl-diphosphatase